MPLTKSNILRAEKDSNCVKVTSRHVSPEKKGGSDEGGLDEVSTGLNPKIRTNDLCIGPRCKGLHFLVMFCHFLSFCVVFLLHVPCFLSISLSMLVKTCVTAIQQLECSPLLYSEYPTHLATRHIEAMACEEETPSGRSSFPTPKRFNNIKSHCVAHVSF